MLGPATGKVRHATVHWAQRIKCVFHIDIETCQACGGKIKMIASFENPVMMTYVIARVVR